MKTLPELIDIVESKGLAFETLADQANWINGFRTAEKIYTKGDEMNQVEEVLKWFQLAVPKPTEKNRAVQLGCHYEEVGEMLEATLDWEAQGAIQEISDAWKRGIDDVSGFNRNALLDSLCDQIVTAIGVAHMFGFDIVGALDEVNRSNFSKFVDGKPVFNEQGKIAKPATYSPPVLEEFLGKTGA